MTAFTQAEIEQVLRESRVRAYNRAIKDAIKAIERLTDLDKAVYKVAVPRAVGALKDLIKEG